MGTVLLKALTTILTRLLASMATEKLLEWAMFKVADAIVKSTKTAHDDAFLVKLKDVYNEQGNRNKAK